MKFLLNHNECTRLLGFDDRLAMLFGTPLLAGMAFLLFSSSSHELTGEKALWCYLISVAHVIMYWVSLRAAVIYTRQYFPEQNHIAKRLTLFICLIVAIVLVLCWISHLITNYYLTFMLELGWVHSSFVFEFIVSFTLGLMVSSIYETVYFFAKYRQSSLEREQLAKENMQSQLAVLRQQINPHFLFNSLNTLVNTIPEDEQKAVLFTQRLAAVYRRVLEYRHRELITLEEEVNALKDYIFLMQTRFEEKLVVNWRGAGAQVQRDYRIVPLTLQLLLENAIKHNVVSSEFPLVVDIEVSDDCLTMTNNLRPRKRGIHSTGWGLGNIRQRYRMVTQREIEIKSSGTTYSVSLPLLAEVNAPAYATP